MYDDGPDAPDTLEPDLATGWGAEDVRALDELAQLGMRLARKLVEEVENRPADAEPLTQPQAAKVALDFSRISRSVRLSLSLKAMARGAPMPGTRRAGSSGSDDDEPYVDPRLHFSVIGACVKERIDEIRADLRHALTDPARDGPERERLFAEFEQRLERETEDPEKFLWGDAWHISERIAKDLGLGAGMRMEMNAKGVFRNWIVSRIGDPGDPLILPEVFDDPYAADFPAHPRAPP